MKPIRLSSPLIVTLSLINFGIILVFLISSTFVNVNAQEVTLTVTSTMPSSTFTSTITETFIIPTQTIFAFQTTSTPTPTIIAPTTEELNFSIQPSLIVSSTDIITTWQFLQESPTPDPNYFSQSLVFTDIITDDLFLYLPVIIDQTPIPLETPTKVLFCDEPTNSISIPDNNITGISRLITISDDRFISNIDVSIDISHERVGDLIISLEHQATGQISTLLHRPGVPETSLGCERNNINAIFDDHLTNDAEHRCSSASAAISGIYIPYTPLNRFISDSIAGNWILRVSDNASSATGKLKKWCIVASLTKYAPIPPPTPGPVSFSTKATINGISGESQALPLDCESRSAVDWAKYFGKSINEIIFFNKLPHSDNPDKGFVGNVYGSWGQIPPSDYGVHAEPVAKLLRSYGLSAYAHRPLSWDALRAEISNNHPVIVWVIDSIANGIPVYYLPEDGLWTIVARYEHTVIITGYSPTSVSYLNGDTIYTKSVEEFLDSWSALENMAIVTYP